MGTVGKTGNYTPDAEELKKLESDAPVYEGAESDSDMEGERSESQRFPFVAVAQGMGEALSAFVKGDIVLDKQYKLAKVGESFEMIVIKARRYYRKYVGKDYVKGAVIPTWATREACLAAGFTLDWPAKGSGLPGPTAMGAMELKGLIAQPEGCEAPHFGLTLDGKVYAPVIWNLTQTLYQGMAPMFDTTWQYRLDPMKLPFRSARFRITAALVAKRFGPVACPNVQFLGMNTPACINELNAFFPRAQQALAAGSTQAVLPAAASAEPQPSA